MCLCSIRISNEICLKGWQFRIWLGFLVVVVHWFWRGFATGLLAVDKSQQSGLLGQLFHGFKQLFLEMTSVFAGFSNFVPMSSINKSLEVTFQKKAMSLLRFRASKLAKGLLGNSALSPSRFLSGNVNGQHDVAGATEFAFSYTMLGKKYRKEKKYPWTLGIPTNSADWLWMRQKFAFWHRLREFKMYGRLCTNIFKVCGSLHWSACLSWQGRAASWRHTLSFSLGLAEKCLATPLLDCWGSGHAVAKRCYCRDAHSLLKVSSVFNLLYEGLKITSKYLIQAEVTVWNYPR